MKVWEEAEALSVSTPVKSPRVTRTSGVLRGSVKHVGTARPESFADIGEAAFGEKGRSFAFVLSIISIYSGLCSLQFVAGMSLQRAVLTSSHSLSSSDFCQYWASIAVFAFTIPISQVRELGALAWATVAGVTSIAVPLIIVFVHAFTSPDYTGNSYVVNHHTAWAPFLSNLIGTNAPPCATVSPGPNWWVTGGVAFAFSGQVLFPEFMHEMKAPGEFHQSILLSSSLMFVIYLSVSCVAYGTLGDTVASPVTNSVPVGAPGVIANLVLLFHVLVGFSISANAFNNIVFVRAFPDSVGKYTIGARLRWFFVTVCTVVGAYIIAEIMPNFGDFVSVLGSTVGVCITFIIPSVCYMKIVQPKGAELACVHVFNAYGVVLLLLGTVGSFDTLISDLAKDGGVFKCST